MPEQITKDLSTFKIYSEDSQLPGKLTIVSIVVNRSINKIPSARLVFKDGDPSSQNFPASNSKELEPGKTIRVEAGFHNKNELIFEGLIIKHHIRLKNGKDSFLVVECRDKAYAMTLSRKSKYYIDSTDSSAIETLLKDYTLKKDIEATTVKHRQLVQYNCSDWDFMISRMELNGMIVIAENGTLVCKKPEIASEATVKANFGADVISFDAALDATHQYNTITCKAWDMASQDIEKSDNPSSTIPSQGDLAPGSLAGKVNQGIISYSHSGKLSQEELKSWAGARQTKNIL